MPVIKILPEINGVVYMGKVALALIVALWPVTADGQATLDAVIITRHGEKATSPKENPPLSPAGEARAQALMHALRDGGVTTIITTEQRRTRDTGTPLVAALHPAQVVVPTSPDRQKHARDVAAAVRKAGGTVLVIDHQLGMPLIIAELGGPAVPTVCDVEFSNLYVLLPADSSRMRLIRSHYGEPDPPHGPGCHISPVSPP
jgi:broad specificity phosphatase PhoE